MVTRIVTGAALAVFVLLPGVIFSDTIVLPLICSAFSVIGVYEIIKCFGQQKINALLIPSLIVGISLPITVRYPVYGNGIFCAFCIFCIYIFCTFAIPVFSNNSITFDEIAKTSLMTIYISSGFSCIVLLRDLEKGQYLFIMCFMAAWITDIFAYFSGMLFGRHKLSPIISPKKTVEGSIGGIVLCSASFVLYGLLLNAFLSVSINLMFLAVLGFFSSLVSQLGDLIASAIKRNHGTKDYGSIFPGHGGVLDRFDSIIAVSPVLYIICFASTF